MHLIDKRTKPYPEAGTPDELEAPAKRKRQRPKGRRAGCGCRVTAGGAKRFVLNYRVNGHERRLTTSHSGE
jgi:hypothetical protein